MSGLNGWAGDVVAIVTALASLIAAVAALRARSSAAAAHEAVKTTNGSSETTGTNVEHLVAIATELRENGLTAPPADE
jgi:hypothetical protein